MFSKTRRSKVLGRCEKLVTVQVLQPQDLNSYLRWKVSNQDLDKVRETL